MTSVENPSDTVRTLFRKLGVEYLDRNRYLPEHLGHSDVRRTFYYRQNRREFDDLRTQYAESLEGGEGLPDLEVRHLGGLLGYGLFTLSSLKPGDLIGEYMGVVRPARPGKPLPGGGYSSDYSWGFPKVRTFGRELEIDAREAGGLLRFANHSTSPSAEPDHFPLAGQWHVVFIAACPIEEGGEITVDYGEAYWSGGERELVI